MSARVYPRIAFASMIAAAVFVLPARAVVPAPQPDVAAAESGRPILLAEKTPKRHASALRARTAYFPVPVRRIIFLGVGF